MHSSSRVIIGRATRCIMPFEFSTAASCLACQTEFPAGEKISTSFRIVFSKGIDCAKRQKTQPILLCDCIGSGFGNGPLC